VETIQDFEDMLFLLNKHGAKYLIIGGLAFIYHAKPRYTKGIDIWVEPSPENVGKVNDALVEFGSPRLLTPNHAEEILQIGVGPDRIDIFQNLGGIKFSTAWESRLTDNYGEITTYWIDIDNLIRVKELIDHPRHQEDVRILRVVKNYTVNPNRPNKLSADLHVLTGY
jgi:hypothetical protein